MSDNITVYINSLSEEDQSILLGDYFTALTNNLEGSNKHVEFLRMQENTISMCGTAYEVLASLDLSNEFNAEEIALLSSLDLFGLLHLKPEESRDSTKVNIAYQKRLIINKVYDYFLPQIQKLAKDLETTYLLEISEKLAQQSSDITEIVKIISDEITVQGLTASEYNNIVTNIQSEIQSFSRLISKHKDFQSIFDEIKSATELISKILLNEELRQTYEDIWISSRASEQNIAEFLGVVDDLSFLELYYKSSKNDVAKKLDQIKADKRFLVTETGDYRLTDQQKEYIKSDITNIYKVFTNREDDIKEYLRIIGLLSPTQIKAHTNLAMLYLYLKNNSEKTYLEYKDKQIYFDSKIILSIENINALIESIDNALKSQDPIQSLDEISLAMVKIWISLTKKINSILDKNSEEYKSLALFKNVLNQISFAINTSYFKGIDIFTNIEGKDSLFNLLVILINNIKLFYSTFIGDFEEIVENVSTVNIGKHNTRGIIESIINSIESRANSQYQITTKLVTLDDQKFKELKVQRNNELLKIVRREKKLLEEVSDHQGIISDLFKNFYMEKNTNFTPEDFDTLLSLNNSNIDNLESVLQKLSTEVIKSYSTLVQRFIGEGKNKNLSLVDLTDVKHEEIDLFMNLQQAIAHLDQIGFYFVTDSKYNFSLAERKEVLYSYLNGWETRLSPTI